MGSKISGHKAGLVYCRISGDVKNCVKHILGQDDFLIYTKTYIFSVALPKPVFLGV